MVHDDQGEGQCAEGPSADEDRATGGPALAELPLRWVSAEPRWNCRTPYTERDVAEATERYRREPMLHPPSVAPEGPERYVLVTGFLRFAVMRRLEGEDDEAMGWFRVVRGTEVDRLLWNLGENTARRDLTGYELVERVWALHSRGVPKERLVQTCGFKISYLNRLLRIRRRAHPELYERFRTDPALTVARMGRLVVHEPAAQLEELQQSEALLRRAAEVEQGYSEELEAGDAPPASSGAPHRTSRRRRLPTRAHVRRLLTVHEKRGAQGPYERGIVASLRHLLYDEPLAPSPSEPSE